MLRDFQLVGEELFLAKLNNSHSGNMSVRNGRMLVITRTGAMLHRLSHGDLVETIIDGKDQETQRASRELPVHQAIYLKTNADAIVHAHPPHVVALSFFVDIIKPVDAEGLYYYPNGIPVVEVKQAVASEEVAEKIPPLLNEFPIVVVRGHGSFAVGKDLNDAFHWTSSLDNVAQIVLLSSMYQTCPYAGSKQRIALSSTSK